MKVRRTPWWHYLVACVLGLLAGMGLAALSEHSGMSLLGAPWFVILLLVALGVVVLVLALQVHKYANTDPRKRPSTWMDPTRAMYTLVLAKALGLAGAALAGWYGGQILMCVSHIEASYYREAVIECAIAAAVCIADMIIGIIGEWLCQLPPEEGAENPKLKRAQRRRRMTQATARTSAEHRESAR